jgi:hypothetical protein
MSQQLVPVTGGQQIVQTTQTTTTAQVLSPAYVKINKLEARPTEWVLGGRPIYRRLPAISETYQIDFFNVVPAANTAVADTVRDIGYVYIPWGEGYTGPNSLAVVASDTNKALIIKPGNIVWKYGTSPVLSTLIDLETLGVISGRYLVAYQLIYDDSPIPNLYQVENFALTGQPLDITSSTDSVIGWRYPAVNAFLNNTNNFWQNKDTLLPTYAQPTTAYLQWTSTLASAYSQLVLRCPASTAYTGTATLSYVADTGTATVSTVEVSTDKTGQYFQFDIQVPSLQEGWKVDFSNLDVTIQSITVSGLVTQLTPQAAPSARSALVIYPENSVPSTVKNSAGETIPATYCELAYVDVSNGFSILNIEDVRYVIHRDYVPVADWLTRPFDNNLINLYEQVSNYNTLWMAPPSSMKQEYAALKEYQITVTA